MHKYIIFIWSHILFPISFSPQQWKYDSMLKKYY